MPGTDAVPRVYLDACMAIHLVERHPDHAQSLRERLILPSGAPAVQVVLSELVRMECRLRPVREGDLVLTRRYDAFFATAGHVWVPMDRAVFDRATGLRAQHRLRTPDALHLAAAIESGCEQFWTHDSRLAAAARGSLAVIDLSS